MEQFVAVILSAGFAVCFALLMMKIEELSYEP